MVMTLPAMRVPVDIGQEDQNARGREDRGRNGEIVR
jgi:hypothetical protein